MASRYWLKLVTELCFLLFRRPAASIVMALLVALVAGLLAVAESQASSETGFLSKPSLDQFISPNVNRMPTAQAMSTKDSWASFHAMSHLTKVRAQPILIPQKEAMTRVESDD